jgi:hypothetical protein
MNQHEPEASWLNEPMYFFCNIKLDLAPHRSAGC